MAPTRPATTESATSRSIFPFLRLPRELRDIVYTFALSLPENKHTNIDGYTRYSINPVWLRLNRQIHQEALAIFRKNIIVAVSTPWQQVFEHVESQGFVPILSTDTSVEKFRPYHLDAQITIAQASEARGPLERFIILLDDLQAFCDFWFYQDLEQGGFNVHLDLTLILRDPHRPAWDRQPLPKPLQKQLLEPFGVVKNLHDVNIEGEHYSGIVKDMRKKMGAPPKTPEECFEDAISFKDAGNTFLQNKEYRQALKKYEESFLAIHILVQGRRRSVWGDSYFRTELRSGPFKGQFGHIVRIMLRFELVANTILAYFEMGEYEEAAFWGMRTINLMGDISAEEPLDVPASKSIGQIYLRTGKACKKLGRQQEAIKFLTTAAGFLPNERTSIEAEMQDIML